MNNPTIKQTATSLVANTKTPGQFRFISFGDVHLGHHRTPSSFIIDNLKRYFNKKRLQDIDAIFITGDLFDRLLTFSDPQVHEIVRWGIDFLSLCALLDIAVFSVEGTPSHEHKQTMIFSELVEKMQIPVDLHYVTTLSIRHIERFGIDILFVPDKWNSGQTDETYRDIRTLMASKNLTKVDFAVMHGAFEYQLPDTAKEPTHNSKDLLALVRYFILIGHVHLMSQVERILAAGSFDRDTHGQEQAKGFFEGTIYSEDRWEVRFVENTHAKRFVTIDVTGKNMERTHVIVKNKVAEMPSQSHIRIRCELGHPLARDLSPLKKEYPHLIWSSPDIRKEKTEEKELQALDFDFTEFTDITEQTIMKLIETDLDRHIHDLAQKERCLRLLQTHTR